MRNKLKRLIAKRPPLQTLQERGLLRGEGGWTAWYPSPSFVPTLVFLQALLFTFRIWASACPG